MGLTSNLGRSSLLATRAIDLQTAKDGEAKGNDGNGYVHCRTGGGGGQWKCGHGLEDKRL